MRNRVLNFLALTFFVVAGVHAQQPSASHLQAVEELFRVMNMSNILDQEIDNQLKAQIELDPQLKELEGLIREFLAKYMSWKSIEPAMVQMYAEEFTEPEIRELIVFYRTPLGQKTITKISVLYQKGVALGQKAIQEHLPDLQEAIEKKAQENVEQTVKQELDQKLKEGEKPPK